MGRVVRLVLATVISAVAVIAAVRLIVPADTDASVRRQLAHLRSELDGGAATSAQASFPEGYFFMYALYGLASVDVGSPADARWALARLESEEGRAPFSAGLTPAYGVFYRGWINWLRGGILSRQPGDAAVRAAFERDSADLAAAFDESPTPFLAAYPGQAWPVDSTVAMASLALHDKLATPRYGVTITRWLAGVRTNLDPATGLIPHTADVDTGQPTSGARGTSQSMIHRFLGEIDPELARSQYLLFRSTFLARPLGLGPAVREYPHGTAGPPDNDSGPLPLGISLSASAVTIGAAKVQGDESLADGLANFGEVAGLPIDTWHTRRYAFGLVPIGDAFLAWSKSARPWAAATPRAPAAGLDPLVARPTADPVPAGRRRSVAAACRAASPPPPSTDHVASPPIRPPGSRSTRSPAPVGGRSSRPPPSLAQPPQLSEIQATRAARPLGWNRRVRRAPRRPSLSDRKVPARPLITGAEGSRTGSRRTAAEKRISDLNSFLRARLRTSQLSDWPSPAGDSAHLRSWNRRSPEGRRTCARKPTRCE